MVKLGLSELIEALKEELRQLNTNPKTPHYFNIDGAEVELNVGITTEASGGISFWIVKLGGKVSKEQIHKIKVKLSVLDNENEIETESTDPKQAKMEEKYGVIIARGGRRLKAVSRNRKAAVRRASRARARR